MRKYEEELYPFWRLPKFVDVTREYAYYYKKRKQYVTELKYN